MRKRVVITGMATINPLGDNLDTYYNNLINGVSGIKKWKSIDMTPCENKVGGDLGDYDYKKRLHEFQNNLPDTFKHVKKLFRSATFTSRITCIGALDAWRDAGMFHHTYDPFRISIVVGGHNLNSNYTYHMNQQYREEPDFIDPLCGIEAIDNNVPALISEILQVSGPIYCIAGACASGNLALRDAFRSIQYGEIDHAVVAGGLFDVSPADIYASSILNSVVVKKELQEDPTQASRPFDMNRNGFVYSHGTATLIIEDLEIARARGAHIYAEILSIHANSNSNHLPMPAYQKQARAMQEVLVDANIAPEQIDYINCHATGTAAGDQQEAQAIHMVLKNHAKNIKVNAPKSMLGHTCWASPLVESISGILQMKHGYLHPTINITNQDPSIDLAICPNTAIPYQANYMLKNSFGFGGINCCSLIKKWEN